MLITSKIINEDLKSIVSGVGLPIHDFEGSRVLITGGCGFLGSWFVALFQYLNENHFKSPAKVDVVDSFIATDKNNHIVDITDMNIGFYVNDINNFKLTGSYDYIIHAAGVASPIYYRRYPIETIKGMVLGLLKLMDSCIEKPVKSFLTFSSSEIYGNPIIGNVPTKEGYYGNVSCIGPRSCYDESKRMEEAICASYHRIHNIPVKWVRPFNISGPGMRKADDRVMPKFIYQALQNQALTVHLPAIQTRTFCYITDAMIGFLKALLIGKNGEVYNIGNQNEEITMEELAKKVVDLVNKKATIDYIEMPTEYPRDQAQRRCPDLTKAFNELGYKTTVDLDTMITRSTKVFKENI